jgi:hypothetical protein
MIRGDQLINPVIWLPALDRSLAILSSRGDLIWPVHPVHSGIDVVLITSSYLEDPCHPVIVRLLPRLESFARGSLSLDGGVIRYKDKTFAKILDAVDLREVSVVSSYNFPLLELGQGGSTYERSCCISSYLPTVGWVLLGSVGPCCYWGP